MTVGANTFAISNNKEMIKNDRLTKFRKMQTTAIKPFMVIGIKVKTSNLNGQSAQDIGKLWAKFMSEDIAAQIPAKTSDEIYSIYTNYEGDNTQPYDTILGCKVSSLDNIPKGMIGQSFEGGQYEKFVCVGDLAQGAVYGTWEEIFAKGLNRTYVADFEVYGAKAQNPNNAEVDIFVGIN